jgi:hypothetical protein
MKSILWAGVGTTFRHRTRDIGEDHLNRFAGCTTFTKLASPRVKPHRHNECSFTYLATKAFIHFWFKRVYYYETMGKKQTSLWYQMQKESKAKGRKGIIGTCAEECPLVERHKRCLFLDGEEVFFWFFC